MKWLAAIGLAFTFALPAPAHVLDEYLQSSYLSLHADYVEVEIDLTPGVAVLPDVQWLIRGKREGQITSSELQTYARSVLGSILLELDGTPKPLELVNSFLPSLVELREGAGTIRLFARAKVPDWSPGRHQLHYQNRHAAAMGVYQVNALRPDVPSLEIKELKRDALQTDFQMSFESAAKSSTGSADTRLTAWATLAALGVVAFRFYASSRNSARQPAS